MKKILILFTLVICCLTVILSGCYDNDNNAIDNNEEKLVAELENNTPVTENDNIIDDNTVEDIVTEEVVELPEINNSVNEEYEVQSLVSLNVRDNPTTSGKIVGIINLKDTLPYIDMVNGWYKVIYDNNIAYVSANSSYTRLKSTSATSATVIESVIDIGMSLLGTPYEYGSVRVIDYNFKEIAAFTGNTFDCSAFVQYSFYVGAGINLYGDSRTMSKQGDTVSYDNITRGNVIFMTSTARQYNTGLERIGHVGIYLGDNKLLHTYGTGGVRITDFNSFWRGRFISAKDMF